MKQKSYYIVNGYVFGTGSLVMLFIFWGAFISIAMPFILFFAGTSFYYFWKANKIKDKTTTLEIVSVYAPSKNASPEQRARFYKMLFYTSLVVFPALSILTISDVNALEKCTDSEASLFIPVAILYKQFGYWSAVLFVPFLGLMTLIGFMYANNKMRQKNNALKTDKK